MEGQTVHVSANAFNFVYKVREDMVENTVYEIYPSGPFEQDLEAFYTCTCGRRGWWKPDELCTHAEKVDRTM